MKEREFYKTTLLGKEKSDIFKKSILIKYPDEDLFEDGELDESTTRKVSITPVEEKILWLLSTGRAVLARWEDLNGR